MADTKVSALTAATTMNDTDEVPINQGGVSKKATIARLNRKITNLSTAAQSLTASTLTLLTGSTLAIPTGVTIGQTTTFQWKVVLSKTAAGAVANVFHVRLGTAGTTADTAILTFTTVAGTAAIDTARIDILLTVRTTGASGILQGTFAITKNAGTIVGFINIPSQCITTTTAATNLTTANLIASLSATTGTGMVTTVNQVVSEVVNV